MNPQPQPQHSRPLWLGALIAAIATPIAYFLALFLVGYLRGDLSTELFFRSLGFLVIFGLPPVLGVVFLVGLPFTLLLRSQGLLTAPYVIAGAAIAGILTMVVLVNIIAQSRLEPEVFGWGAGLGLFAGLIFCLAAGIRFRKPQT